MARSGQSSCRSKPGLHDHFVFFAHGVGERGEILFVGGIVFVGLKDGDGAGRDGVHETFRHLGFGQSFLHVGDVLLDGLQVFHFDRTLADRAFIGGGVARFHQAVAIFGIVVEILRGGAGGIAFEAGEPVANVSGVTDFAGLAVADDIDSGFGLALHQVRSGTPHCFVELSFVDLFAAILGEEKIDHFLRAREAADMSGKNAIGTEFHLESLLGKRI